MKAKEKLTVSKWKALRKHIVDLSDDKMKAIQERLKERSKSAPALRARSKMDVIRACFDQIEAMRKNGFRADEIAAEIAETGGFEITPGTLKNYMHRIRVERDQQSHPRPRAARKRKASRDTAGEQKETVARAQAPAPVQQEETTKPNDRGTFKIKPDREDL